MPTTRKKDIPCWRLGFDRVMSTSTHHCSGGHLPTARLVTVDLLTIHVAKGRTAAAAATVILCPAFASHQVIESIPCCAMSSGGGQYVVRHTPICKRPRLERRKMISQRYPQLRVPPGSKPRCARREV